ncbi:MAG: hypothetical protein ACYDA0_06300 [Candidatus Dormibacteraceae bacterium]
METESDLELVPQEQALDHELVRLQNSLSGVERMRLISSSVVTGRRSRRD